MDVDRGYQALIDPFGESKWSIVVLLSKNVVKNECSNGVLTYSRL
jgi:hypothetical protein